MKILEKFIILVIIVIKVLVSVVMLIFRFLGCYNINNKVIRKMSVVKVVIISIY